MSCSSRWAFDPELCAHEAVRRILAAALVYFGHDTTDYQVINMGKVKAKAKRKKRIPHIVCKPCWELKYCPYGPYVEHFPPAPGTADLKDVRKRYNALLARFARGEFKTEKDILSAVDHLEYLWPERWEALAGYDTSEIECRVFGHVCPVFFNKEPFTETKESRRFGRHIPREIMLKVVRRDGPMCQVCRKNVSDDELEFDHIIPYSKGGPVCVENLRVLCSQCNSKKTDKLDELLEPKIPAGSTVPTPVQKS